MRPFVYRRYLDYGVFESLREMKALIAREIERRELADNVKLGPGGIREIEFIVQALQLTRGGRDRRLQTPSLLRRPGAAWRSRACCRRRRSASCAQAYVFLRRVENRLQMLARCADPPAARRRRSRASGWHWPWSYRTGRRSSARSQRSGSA